jgi:SAM-dependent methyltransferase
MWKTPFYHLRYGKKNIVVDVTLSAPRYLKPVSILPDVLAYLRTEKKIGIKSVLDFGAGKLRNARYLVKHGYEVYAVEFEAQFKQYDLSAKQLSEANKNANFRELIFPGEFKKCGKKFDLVLLSNVIHIIPAPKHRVMVLRLCADKLRDGGYLLWISQYGDTHYKDRLVHKIGDGFLLHVGGERSTFYREFSSAEIDGMVTRRGFRFVKSFPFWKNQARLFQKA